MPCPRGRPQRLIEHVTKIGRGLLVLKFLQQQYIRVQGLKYGGSPVALLEQGPELHIPGDDAEGRIIAPRDGPCREFCMRMHDRIDVLLSWKTEDSHVGGPCQQWLEIDDQLETPCAANPDNGDLGQIRRMCRELSEKTRQSLP